MILNDVYYEEMAHPHLFPTGKFGYKVKRNKYFNQRLLNYSQNFFAHLVMQKILLNYQISIVMRTITSKSLNVGILSNNFKATVQHFISQDKVCSFMSSIKGILTYWKKVLFEVLEMVKNLGIPTCFTTLSCADLR